jgi:hypothetical protein
MAAACAQWPDEPFLFCVAYDGTECTVRFWKEREGEPVMDPNLEAFRGEGVLTAHMVADEHDETLGIARCFSSLPRWVRRHLNQRVA